MPTAVIVDAVRTAGGKRNGKLSGWHPADLAAEDLNALVERNDLDPALVEDVIMGCVMQVGDQGAQHRPQRRARRRLARVGARHHGRPPVRLVAAGGPLRRPGRDRRRLRRRGRRRRRGMTTSADGRVGHPGLGIPFGPTVWPATRTRRPRPAGHLGRADRRQVGPHPRGPRRLRRREPAAGGPGHRRGPLRQRDRAGQGRAASTARRARSSRPTSSSPPTRASAPAPPSRRSPT